MKLIILIFITLFSLSALGTECHKEDSSIDIILLATNDLTNKEINQSSDSSSTYTNVERRGCCSWHSGVCGCSNGRAVCCDNTLSKSCGCD